MSSASILIRLPDLHASREKMEQPPDLQRPDSQPPDLQPPDLQRPDSQPPDLQPLDLQRPDSQPPDSQPVAQEDAITNSTAELTHSKAKAEPVELRRPAQNKSRAASGWASTTWSLLVGILLIALFIVSYLAIAGSRPDSSTVDQQGTAENNELLGGLPIHSHESAMEQSTQLQTPVEKNAADAALLDAISSAEDAGAFNNQDEVELPSPEPSFPSNDSEPLDVKKVDIQQNALHGHAVNNDVAATKPDPQTVNNNGYSYPVTDPATYWYPDSTSIAKDSTVPAGQRSAELPDGSGRQSRDFRPPGAAALNGTIESPTIGFRR